MNEEAAKKIQKLKTMYKDNEEFVKNGTKYHRFVLAELEVPKELNDKNGKKPYLTICYKGDSAYVVLTKTVGITEEEKERKEKAKQERKKQREQKKVEAKDLKQKIKATKKEIKNLAAEFKFNECQDMKTKLDSLEAEYKEKYGRNKK